MMKKVSVLILIVLSTACEYLPFNGGKLEGISSPAPENWAKPLQREIIQLETSPSDPYSVNLWIVNIDNSPYVYAGENFSRWAKNIIKDKRVVLKAQDKLYKLEATRLINHQLFEKFASAWEAKYGNRPMNENPEETYLFKLSRREAN
jgi:hypothetical protein